MRETGILKDLLIPNYFLRILILTLFTHDNGAKKREYFAKHNRSKHKASENL